jgi:probable H4MPT-linked C1 transfer pathway protein
MTGELADLFPDRASGVARLIAAARERFAGRQLQVWAGRAGFLTPAAALRRPLDVASANWLATATLVGSRLDHALLVDIGSTTTDIVPIEGGARFAGYTDRERLAAGELVYQGLTRTPVMGIADAAPFAGRRVPLMREHFATAADVWRLLDRLDEADDQHPAADGGAKSIEASARRLARMIGADLADAAPRAWRDLAAALASAQLRRIEDGLRLVLSRVRLPEGAPLVGAGCGRLLVADLAHRLGRPHRDLANLLDAAPQLAAAAATCAPAAAVALLLAESSAARTAAKASGSSAAVRAPAHSARRKPR